MKRRNTGRVVYDKKEGRGAGGAAGQPDLWLAVVTLAYRNHDGDEPHRTWVARQQVMGGADMMGIGATDRWGAMTVRRVTGGWNPGPGEPGQEPLALWRRW